MAVLCQRSFSLSLLYDRRCFQLILERASANDVVSLNYHDSVANDSHRSHISIFFQGFLVTIPPALSNFLKFAHGFSPSRQLASLTSFYA